MSIEQPIDLNNEVYVDIVKHFNFFSSGHDTMVNINEFCSAARYTYNELNLYNELKSTLKSKRAIDEVKLIRKYNTEYPRYICNATIDNFYQKLLKKYASFGNPQRDLDASWLLPCQWIDEIAKQSYESKHLQTELVFTEPTDNCFTIKQHISTFSGYDSEDRSLKKWLKIMQLHGTKYCMWKNGFTLAVDPFCVASSYTSQEPPPRIIFTGRGIWHFYIGKKRYFTSKHGILQVNTNEDSHREIRNHFQNQDITPSDILIDAIDEISTKGICGTLVLFNEDEKLSMERYNLRKTCFEIDYQFDGSSKQLINIMRSSSKIDGATLLTSQGKCIGIGAILDGISIGRDELKESRDFFPGKTLEESQGRGARYNSAIRYYNRFPDKQKPLIIVFSEDGHLDWIPS